MSKPKKHSLHSELQSELSSGVITNLLDVWPESPSAWDDNFNNEILDSKWIWLNRGEASYDLTELKGFIKLTKPEEGINLRALVQARPVGDFSIMVKFVSGATYVGSELYAGVTLVNSITGAHMLAGMRNTGAALNMGQLSYTDFIGGAPYGYANYKPVSTFYWVKIVIIGTNYNVYYSPNGILWGDPSFTGPVPLDFDKIGIGVQIGNGVKGHSAYFDWFKVIES